ncbi:MAG: YkgJ family cysteine cluster protein [Proteobacteria bacterium]|nr:YkgJ family cysteine cluster protein [Pseudomonadota bacterium]
MNNGTEFVNYSQLIGKIDDKFAQIFERYRNSFQCQAGCYGCCKSGLTVSSVEAKFIEFWLKRNPSKVKGVKEALANKYFGKEYCGFLNEEGSCSIYEARPIVCRSHGAPTLVPSSSNETENSAEFAQDVCPLNFSEGGLSNVASSHWIRLDTVSLLLKAVNREFNPQTVDIRVDLENIV